MTFQNLTNNQAF
jgi:hypothetical protein